MASTIQVGMVGLDTSHCVAFTKILNDQNDPYHIPGARIVGAYAGGSDQFSLSRNRIQGFTEQLTKDDGIRLYDTIPALVQDVDAILLESVDGRQHLEQFAQMAMGKPVYIDKPFATSLEDALAMARLARESGTPVMSCSSLRYAAGIADLVGADEKIVSCEAFGPAAILEDYPGLFWYGIHSAEMLFAFMGTGCASVQCIRHADVDVVIGQWRDGRTGIMKGTRFDKGTFGCVVHTDQGTRCGIAQSTPPYYYLLLQNVISFFETGISPIDLEETLDIVAFLEAADASQAQQGRAVALETTTDI